MVPFVGAAVNGARRWFGVGIGQFQPSEFLKPFFIVTTAWLLSLRAQDKDLPVFPITLAMTAAIGALLMLEPDFGQTMIFGLVCAARSCPPLGNRAFTGRSVRAQLARNAGAYLASPYNRYDASRNRLDLSKIFEWYKGDFGGDAGIREFVKKYGTAQMKSGVSPSTTLGLMEYDWTLNAR